MTWTHRARLLLRAHGLLLLLLGLANAAASFAATRTHLDGPFTFLYADPFPEVGFLQAYLLAALVGVVLLIGSWQERFWMFDLVGIGMHLVPPIALLVMYDQIALRMGPSVIALSISIHSVFITWECVALWAYRRGRAHAH